MQALLRRHEQEQLEISKTKALISIYNELYCQTTMEYNQLAAFVGVQLDSSRDGMSESAS